VDWNYLLWRFDGRIGRQTFWIAFLTVAAVEIVFHLTAYSSGALRLIPVISLAFGYPETAVLVKRGHDGDIPTWVPVAFYAYSAVIDFLFMIGADGTKDDQGSLMTVLSILWAVFALGLIVGLGCRKGTSGPNRFGPDPLGPRIASRRNGSAGD
jgi:uncharacterized membrane protein YhaH (DUF805 family)